VNGIVDEKLRALIRVPVSASTDGERKEIVVWIDTAFNGGLVIPKPRIEELGLVHRVGNVPMLSGLVWPYLRNSDRRERQ